MKTKNPVTRTNPVAKNLFQFNKPKVEISKKKYNRKNKKLDY